tara:strand:- start:2368 stop:3570 length:1203 start_codon:yes stop_codon:yes gene_type:complete
LKIIYFIDNFFPETCAPAVRTFENAKLLVERGHEVTVVTCCPNFPEGAIFPGYKNKLLFKENIEGIKVYRVWTFITKNSGTFLRALDYLSFALSSAFFAFFLKKRDYIIASSPQFFTLFAGYFYSVIKKSRFIVEIRDLWPKSIEDLGVITNRNLLKPFEYFESFFYRKALKNIVVSESFINHLVKRGAKAGSIEIITNGFDEKNLNILKERPPFFGEELVNKRLISYVGTIGLSHPIEIIIDLARYFSSYKDVFFLIIGSGENFEKIQKKIEEENLKNIRILPRIPREQVFFIYKNSFLMLSILKQINLFKTVIPSKIFEVAPYGKPIVYFGPRGQASKIIEENNFGYSVKSKEELQIIIEKLLNNKVEFSETECIENSKKYYRSSQITKMEEILSELN